jgi:hypothetical protein
MSDAIDVSTEDPMTLQSTPAPVAMSATALRTLEKAYLEEIRSAQPDIARMRALRAGITAARRRLERAHEVLPPHTD